MDKNFLEDTQYKAQKIWKWKNPWIAAILALIHPVGMLYTSIPASIIYLIIWIKIYYDWTNRPFGVGLVLAGVFSFYAFNDTKWKNAAIEKWRYGLSGTGIQNPKKSGLRPIFPDK